MAHPSLTEDKLQEFFSALTDRMEIAAGYEGRIAHFEAPRFNVFEYIEPDENKVTAILADLLDPNGSHGQGDVFLQSFIRMIGFDARLGDEVGNAIVRTEYRTRLNRRIDLFIGMGRHILGLENKIDAGEQPGQISDYMDWLTTEARGHHWFLVFLTPDGHDPTTCDENRWKDAREKGNVTALSYRQLSNWLRSCVSSTLSDRVRGFIQDMANWTESLRGGNVASDLRQQIILDFAKRSNGGQHLETLLAVHDTSDAVRKGLICDFAGALEAKLKSEFSQPEWNFKSNISESGLGAKYPGISIRKSFWPGNCEIRIEADSLESSFGFYYGIAWKDASAPDRERVHSALARLANRKPSAVWPWWDYVPKFTGIDVKKWNQSETIMCMMGNQRQHLIDHFANLFIDVYQAVKDVLGPSN